VRIQARNNALAGYVSKKTQSHKRSLQDTRHHLKRAKRRAKNREWQKALAEKCNLYEFATNPKQAWKVANEIQEGFTGHLPKNVDKQFIKQNGDQPRKYEGNADTVRLHLSRWW
jgi:hypothetical protein